MRGDECSGPGCISLSKRWDRSLAIVEPQIETGTPIEVVEDAIQGDLRFCVARE